VRELSYSGFVCWKALFISENIQRKFLEKVPVLNKNYTTNSFGVICSIQGGLAPTNPN